MPIPNKYSHANVLSQFESQGLNDFYRLTSRSHSSSKRSSTIAHSSSTHLSRPHPQPSKSPQENDPYVITDDRPRNPRNNRAASCTKPSYPRLYLEQATTDLRAYDQEHSLMPPNHISHEKKIPSTRSERTARSPQKSARAGRRRAVGPNAKPYRRDNGVTPSTNLSIGNTRPAQRDINQDVSTSRPYTPRTRSLSNETAIYDQQNPVPEKPRELKSTQHGVNLHGYSLRRPPSPPLTPEQSDDFSLDVDSDVLSLPSPPVPQLRPPIPDRSSRRSVHSASSTALSAASDSRSNLNEKTKSKSASQVYRPQDETIFPHRPSLSATISSSSERTRSNVSYPTSPQRVISTPVRRPSLSATTSPPKADSTIVSSPSTSSIKTLGHQETPDEHTNFDLDLEPLPTELYSDLDYETLPREDRTTNADMFSEPSYDLYDLYAPMSGALSSRPASFDSVAPPPIGRMREPPTVLKEIPRPRTDRFIPAKDPPRAIEVESPVIKKFKKRSMSSLLNWRSPTPKGHPYSQMKSGKEPIPVSVSRTSIPSIPTLFPDYRGPFPPAEKPVEALDGPARPGRPAVRPRRHSVQVPSSIERRLSWLKS